MMGERGRGGRGGMGSTSTSLTVSYVELLSNLWGDGEMRAEEAEDIN